MKKTLLILASLMISTTTLASSEPVIVESASKDVLVLSECASSLAEVSTARSWVGSIEKRGIEDGLHSYSYTYNVFKSVVFSTHKIGSVRVSKEYIANPPADGSSFLTHCSYIIDYN